MGLDTIAYDLAQKNKNDIVELQNTGVVSDIATLTGTNVSIDENTIYTITISEATTINNSFDTSSSKHLQSMLYLKLTANVSITWTGFTFVNGTIPTLVNGNCYRVIFEYNPLKNSVVVGVIHDGAVV